jgi:arylsulfatase A-like enzyme
MQAHGYRNGLLSNTVMLNQRGFERGFDRVSHLPARWNLSGEGERLSEAAVAFVRDAKSDPVFLYLHYLDPHAPYSPGQRFQGRFGPFDSLAALRLYDDVTPNLPELRASGFGPGDSRYEELVGRYDAEIATTDAALESLFRGLSELGVLDRMLVIVTSDHGEEFLEHDWVEHGWTLYEESLRVPLLFWAPAILRPVRVSTRTSHVDVAPTVLALLGITVDDALDGDPVFTIGSGSIRPRTDARVQIAELLLARRQVVRAVLMDDWKYIATWREIPARDRSGAGRSEFDASPNLWGSPEREELYNLRVDPREQRDLSIEEPGVRKELADVLAAFRDGDANYEFAPAGPPTGDSTPELSSESAQRLKALGYAE